MWKATLYDLDGVLVHTDQYHYEAWETLADGLGTPFDDSVNNRLRGVSRMESLEIILEKHKGLALSATQKAELAARKNALYRERLQYLSPADVAPAVTKTLNDFHKAGFRQAIGSSSKNARFILERVGLLNFSMRSATVTVLRVPSPIRRFSKKPPPLWAWTAKTVS